MNPLSDPAPTISMAEAKKMAKIGLALSAEKNTTRLLDMIVSEARSIANADAGTLYIFDKDKNRLLFKILQNDTITPEPKSDNKRLSSVPLYKDGKPNFSNVSSYCALTGETINIADVYKTDGFDFKGPREYDAATGYRSGSMLVIPMKNHEDDLIGVLQLLNATSQETGKVIPFKREAVELVASLASQAGVALTNAQLLSDMKALFNAFIKSIATAIDEKSPYTGGHIKRVVDLTKMIAKQINASKNSTFKSTTFSKDQLEELRLSAWMHDVGKITTPEHVIDKKSRLETIWDRIDIIASRFQIAAKAAENRMLKKKVQMLQQGGFKEAAFEKIENRHKKLMEEMEKDLSFLMTCNASTTFMDDEKIRRVMDISKKTFMDDGANRPLITGDEAENLCIRKGTLTTAERELVEKHASVTYKILQQLPFPKNLAKVPEFAASHHEKPNGSGYPRKLSGTKFSLQARIMAIADIFEALTARDRPYKKPMNLSKALEVMKQMKQVRLIDADVFDLFMEKRIYENYAKKHMGADQIDVPYQNETVSTSDPPA